jgi:tRNA threonylcarbamoyladenosine biosynthesis protein TsaB
MKPGITVALEGATYQGSVALLRGTDLLAERSLENPDAAPDKSRGDRLMPAVAEAMKDAGVRSGDIARIVCGSGPGSFTSLRVAGSIAKGFASGYGVELYAVNSLLLTVAGAMKPLPPGRYLSLLNAMRGEYFALRVMVDHDGRVIPVGTGSVDIVGQGDVSKSSSGEERVHCIGPGQEIDEIPHARGVARMLGDIVKAGPVDLATWEPSYGRLAEAQVRWEATHGRPLNP